MKNARGDTTGDLFFGELGAMLRAYEGPEHVRRRLNPARHRVRTLVVAVALSMVCVTGAATVAVKFTRPGPSQALRHVELPPLSRGPSAIDSGGTSGASMVEIPLEKAVEEAETIFVGRVVAIGPGENVSPGDPAGMIICPVRYRVERVLRGDLVDTIDLGDWVSDYWQDDGGFAVTGKKSGVFPAEVGKRYIIFVTHVHFGERRVASLTPLGYSQNVYELDGDNTAVNAWNKTVQLDELEQRLILDSAN